MPRPVVGYRGWAFGENDWLVPPHHRRTRNTPWRPRGLAIATCEIKKSHSSPPAHDRCRCGLYGHYSIKDAFKKEARHVAVMGAFIGFGEVAYHERGFRSGKGRIIGLMATGPKPNKAEKERIKKVADLYEIPFFTNRRDLRAEAKRWGVHRKPVPNTDPYGISGLMRSVAEQERLIGESPAHYVSPAHYGVGGRFPPLSQTTYPGTSNHGGGRLPPGMFTVEVELDLRPGTHIRRSPSRRAGGYEYEVEGLDRPWEVLHGSITREEESPYLAVKQRAFPHLRERILIHIRAHAVSRQQADRLLYGLQRIGHINRVDQRRIS